MFKVRSSLEIRHFDAVKWDAAQALEAAGCRGFSVTVGMRLSCDLRWDRDGDATSGERSRRNFTEMNGKQPKTGTRRV